MERGGFAGGVVAGGGDLQGGAIDVSGGGGDDPAEFGAAEAEGFGAVFILLLDPAVLEIVADAEAGAATGDFRGEGGIEGGGGIAVAEHEVACISLLGAGVGAGIEHQQAPGGDRLTLEPGQREAPTAGGFLLGGEEGGALEAEAVEMEDEGDADDVVELGADVGAIAIETVHEGDRGAGLEEGEAVDFEDEVVAFGAVVAVGNDALAEVGAGVGHVGLDALAGEAAGDGGHHLLGDGVAGEVAAVAGDEGGVLEFIGSGADEPVAVHVGGEDEAFGFAALDDEDAEVAVDADIEFIQFAADDAEERILLAGHGGLADELAEDFEESIKIGGIINRHPCIRPDRGGGINAELRRGLAVGGGWEREICRFRGISLLPSAASDPRFRPAEGTGAPWCNW